MYSNSKYVMKLRTRIRIRIRKTLTMGRKSVKLRTEDVITQFYKHVLDGNLENLHIPHSDVFYVREAVQNYYGKPFTLEHVEWAMKMEGWKDGD